LNDFLCDGCGLCCKRIGHIPELSEFADSEGACTKLDSDGRCSIYNDRPLICNISEYYKTELSDKLTWHEFKSLNYEACEKLKDEDENEI
jgi:Fe-S-cluster containining protein